MHTNHVLSEKKKKNYSEICKIKRKSSVQYELKNSLNYVTKAHYKLFRIIPEKKLSGFAIFN